MPGVRLRHIVIERNGPRKHRAVALLAGEIAATLLQTMIEACPRGIEVA